jgi:hypothetical protein
MVADTENWEPIAAKTLDELADEGTVICSVKNAFMPEATALGRIVRVSCTSTWA